MIIKSLNAASPREQRIWKLVRGFVPKRLGWFYEGCPNVPGQMWYADRKALYETIRRYKPLIVCESGTWLGGGSTYFIAQALRDNGKGVLYTTESNAEFYAAAIQSYEHSLSRLRPFVDFHFGTSAQIYPSLLEKIGMVDAVLLDGAEDAQETMDEFQMFELFLSPNAIVMAHDWNTDKMLLLRPLLENAAQWTLRQMVIPPHSVGFVVFQRTQATGTP
jgi:predicted O-methyltransferase YrrM